MNTVNFVSAVALLSACALCVVGQFYPHHGPFPGHHGIPHLPAYPSFPTIRIPAHHGHHGHHGGIVASPHHGHGPWPQLKSIPISNTLADKLFPFTIRIASAGEPHLPVVRVGHSPYRTSAGLWGAPGNVAYAGPDVHLHQHGHGHHIPHHPIHHGHGFDH